MGRPTRREILLVSGISLLVVIGAVVASIVTVSSIPAPSYASDAPIATSLLASSAELPGWQRVNNDLYQPAQVVSNPSLTTDAAILAKYRPCAFLVGPTRPHQVTALADNAFDEGRSNILGAQLISESVLYGSADPVEADVAAARSGHLAACMDKLLAATAQGASVRGRADLHPVGLPGHLGNVQALAVAGLWTTYETSSGSLLAHLHIEVVLLAAARAEVVVVLENPSGDVPPAVLDSVLVRSAQELRRHFD